MRIKTPAALVHALGAQVVIGEPVRFSHRGDEWVQRVAARRAVRYDISVDRLGAAGIWMPPGKPNPNPYPTSMSCAVAGCWGWI